MSMNLTAHRPACPHCKREFKIDLYQTPTEVTWHCLYKDPERKVQRTWQETREEYIKWFKANCVENEKDLRARGYKGKALKREMQVVLDFAQEHINELSGDEPIEFSYI